MIYSSALNKTCFFQKEEAYVFDMQLSSFFELYSLSKEQKIDINLKRTVGHEESKRMLNQFIHDYMYGKKITPVFTAFVQLLMSAPDISNLLDKHISVLITKSDAVRTKELLVTFFNYARKLIPVHYNELMRVKEESSPISAYDDETYLALSSCIFNAEYIYDHSLYGRYRTF